MGCTVKSKFQKTTYNIKYKYMPSPACDTLMLICFMAHQNQPLNCIHAPLHGHGSHFLLSLQRTGMPPPPIPGWGAPGPTCWKWEADIPGGGRWVFLANAQLGYTTGHHKQGQAPWSDLCRSDFLSTPGPRGPTNRQPRGQVHQEPISSYLSTHA